MSSNVINGLSVPPVDPSEKVDKEIDLYIGVFFDGTNNNKYQVMLGKYFRRKKIYEKHKQGFEELGIRNWNEILRKPRSYWEKEKSPVKFTVSELDYLYFGYGNINSKDDNVYQDNSNHFVEKKNLQVLENNKLTSVSAKSDDADENEILKKVAESMISEGDTDSFDSFEGAPAQNATYTNVAILESLYKVYERPNDKIIEKHISLYIEGSGTDMQISAATSMAHKGGVGLMGLGKGTGPTGVEAKVRKASIMVNNIIYRYSCLPNVTDIRLHFDICGFSRGSACARIFSYVINANPEKPTESYKGEHSIKGDPNQEKLYKRLTNHKEEFLKIGNKIKSKTVRNLLIADTVSSIGVIYNPISLISRPLVNGIGFLMGTYENTRTEVTPMGSTFYMDNKKVDAGTDDVSTFGLSTYHYENVDDYGLWATSLSKNTVHICALDEIRENFALVDIQSSIDSKAVKGTEIFIPGCHTDIGGAASIGIEEAYIVNKRPNRRFFKFMGQSKQYLDNNDLLDVSINSLKQLGWLSDSTKAIDEKDKGCTGRANDTYVDVHDEASYSENYWINKSIARHDNIIMYRHVKPGYSNIALSVFHDKADGDIFDIIPNAYVVPAILENFAQKVKNCGIGRHFFYPENEEDYKKLRENYIHFSFNEQSVINDIANNSLVNGPEFAPYKSKHSKIEIASRIIYKGSYGENNERTKNRIHLFDYEVSAQRIKIF